MTQQLTKPVSIVLADDHSIVREGLAAFCDARPELHIVGQCADGLAAVEMIKALQPISRSSTCTCRSCTAWK